ncbi:hypothetical protein ACFVVM_32790 [Nocardia sp. NPDC058176]|uniref:hypothetical protein n=1 Tax=Nocardia sp. NPDC058176 TaxID=3346368 RepID=UPI0036DB71EA
MPDPRIVVDVHREPERVVDWMLRSYPAAALRGIGHDDLAEMVTSLAPVASGHLSTITKLRPYANSLRRIAQTLDTRRVGDSATSVDMSLIEPARTAANDVRLDLLARGTRAGWWAYAIAENAYRYGANNASDLAATVTAMNDSYMTLLRTLTAGPQPEPVTVVFPTGP